MTRKRGKQNTQKSRQRREARRARRKQEEKRSRQHRNAIGGTGDLDPFGMGAIDPFGVGIDDFDENWGFELDPSDSAPRCSCCGAISRLRGLSPPHIDRCESPVHLDAAGHAVPDPYAILDLAATPSSGVPAADQVQDAYLRKLREYPPELEPERNLEIRGARERLSDPARVVERELGVLHAPSAAAWGLPERGIEDPRAPRLLGARERLLGQLVVYALVENLLSGPIHQHAAQQDLF